MCTATNLLEKVTLLKSHFDYVSFHHIYSDQNQIFDGLSKEATQHELGTWMIKEEINL